MNFDMCCVNINLVMNVDLKYLNIMVRGAVPIMLFHDYPLKHVDLRLHNLEVDESLKWYTGQSFIRRYDDFIS